MSRRAIKAINWAAIAERLPESEKNMLASFKAKTDQYLRRMTANPDAAPKIDWAYYKKNIATPALVDKFQKEYEALSVPYPADKYTAQIESEEKKMMVELEEFLSETSREIESHKKEAERLKSLLPISELTMEEFCEQTGMFDPKDPTIWPHTPDVQLPDVEVMEKQQPKD